MTDEVLLGLDLVAHLHHLHPPRRFDNKNPLNSPGRI